VTGVISDVRPEDLAGAIIKILDSQGKYLKNVKDERNLLIKKFEEEPISQHINLYRRLVK
jgi:hypothetical protein